MSDVPTICLDHTTEAQKLRFLQSQFDNLVSNLVRNTVPDVGRLGRSILQCSLTTLQIPVIPFDRQGIRDAREGAVDVVRGTPSLASVRRADRCVLSTRFMISSFSDAPTCGLKANHCRAVAYLILGLPYLLPDR
jgi:hypothetical protein